MRDVEVNADITADTFLRDFFETAHINNTDMLDSEIYVAWTGMNDSRRQGAYYSRHNLPKSVGFSIKTTLDKDFRPEYLQGITTLLQLMLSGSVVAPNEFDAMPWIEKLAHGYGINPAKFRRKRSIADQVLDTMLFQKRNGQLGLPDRSGGGRNLPGPANDSLVPTDPNPAPLEMSA